MYEPRDAPVANWPPIYPWRILLTNMFMVCLLGGLVLAVKTIAIAGLDVSSGVLIFPLTYAIVVIITEVYGFATGERMIYSGMLCLIFFLAILEIVLHAPAAPSAANAARYFAALYTLEDRVILVVILSFLAGQIAAIWTMRVLMRLNSGRLLMARLFLAPFLAQAVTAFIGIGVLRYKHPGAAVGMITNRLIFDLAYSIICAPLIWIIVLSVRRLEIAGIRAMQRRVLREAPHD